MREIWKNLELAVLVIFVVFLAMAFATHPREWVAMYQGAPGELVVEAMMPPKALLEVRCKDPLSMSKGLIYIETSGKERIWVERRLHLEADKGGQSGYQDCAASLKWQYNAKSLSTDFAVILLPN